MSRRLPSLAIPSFYPARSTPSVSSILTPEIGLDPEPLGAEPGAVMGGGVLPSWEWCKGRHEALTPCSRARSGYVGADTTSLQGPLLAKAVIACSHSSDQKACLKWKPASVMCPLQPAPAPELFLALPHELHGVRPSLFCAVALQTPDPSTYNTG